MQREDQPVMTTELERIAEKARCDLKMAFDLSHKRKWRQTAPTARAVSPQAAHEYQLLATVATSADADLSLMLLSGNRCINSRHIIHSLEIEEFH